MGSSPGPWRWTYLAFGDPAFDPEDGPGTSLHDRDGSPLGFYDEGPNSGGRSPENIANRGLIAAAPEMATMLKSLEWAGICEGRRNQCCSCLNFSDEGHSPDCRLAKLLGELP